VPLAASFIDSSGEHRWVGITAQDLRANRSVGGIILTCHDTTEPTRLHQRVEHQALHDPLTGLPNRTLFANRLEMAFKRRARTGRDVAVFYLDLDRFKPVNDTYGHKAGDLVLREVASRFQAAVRESDTLARMGGDEFAVLVDEADPSIDLADMARRLAATVDRPIDVDGTLVSLGVSIGIAVADRADRNVDELLHRADEAMYAAKGNAAVRWHIATREPVSAQSATRLQ
jgi:diguanylate cyclase (GGDEF)-like protein